MLLGIDVGTTGTKVAIYTLDGAVVSNGYSEYTVDHPHPTWAEQDASLWISALKQALNQALTTDTNLANEITAITVSGQAPTVVPVDKAGEPVAPAMIWLDNRATKEIETVKKLLDEKALYLRHGIRLAPSFPFPKILWLRENRPDVFKQVRWFHQTKDFIVNRLTDLHVTDTAHATGYFCLDVTTQKAIFESFDTFDLDPQLVPEIKPCNAIIGETSNAAKTFGLPSGIPVVNGSVDAIMAVMGIGVLTPNVVCEVAGTSTVQSCSTSKPLMDPTSRYLVNIHPLGNMWSASSVINTTGAVLRWFRDNFWKLTNPNYPPDQDPYHLFDNWVTKSPVGANGLLMLPYLQGERSPYWDPFAKGMFFGLTLKHTIYDMVRAIYESSALVNLHNIQELSKIGLDPQEVRITGGPAMSEPWNQMKADAYGLPLLHPKARFAENQGDAMLAGIATKQISVEQAKNWVTIENTYQPNKEATAQYQQLLDIFIQLYLNTKDLMKTIQTPS